MSFSHHEPCPKCGSSDNLARYTDGGASCFTGSCNYWEKSGSPEGAVKAPKKAGRMPELGEFMALNKRGISLETCKKMRYSVGQHGMMIDKQWVPKVAQIVHVPNVDGTPVAAKVRMAGKNFRYIGDTDAACLVFQNIWPAGGLKLVITEGEIDALSVSQIQGNKYPVVSLPNGVDSAVQVCTRAREYINSFNEVVLMFDQDEVGRDAAREVSQLFQHAKIAQLPLHDANDMLLAGRGPEVINAVFNAQPWAPDGVITLSSLREELTKPIAWGLRWNNDELNAVTFGRREGELYFIGAGVGIGKTDWCLQQVVDDAMVAERSAVFLLEQPVVETGKRLAGKLAKKQFHLPPDVGNYTTEDLLEAVDELVAKDDVRLYDHFGAKDWETISDNITHLAGEGIRHFWIDHITALAAHAEDERRFIEQMTEAMSSQCQKLGINMYVVSHLATPEGKSHEEGGRVQARHFKGSRSIAQWAHYMFGLERNTQHDNPFVATVTTIRCVKDRYSGRANGFTGLLGYDMDTGMQYVLSPAEVETYNQALGGSKEASVGDF